MYFYFKEINIVALDVLYCELQKILEKTFMQCHKKKLMKTEQWDMQHTDRQFVLWQFCKLGKGRWLGCYLQLLMHIEDTW